MSPSTPRSHRAFLVVYVGLLTYAVKVIYSPQVFVLADELIHLSVAQHVAASHTLFAPIAVEGANVASDYPGLESITVGLSDVTGLSLFVSGLILIGVARIVMMLALFRLAEAGDPLGPGGGDDPPHLRGVRRLPLLERSVLL